MPRSITIRDVPDDIADELAARAAKGGRSLQEYLKRELGRLTSYPDQDELWVRINERKARMGTHLSVEDILDARDADRR